MRDHGWLGKYTNAWYRRDREWPVGPATVTGTIPEAAPQPVLFDASGKPLGRPRVIGFAPAVDTGTNRGEVEGDRLT